MPKIFRIGSNDIYAPESHEPPPCSFVGRREELRLCRAAFGIGSDGRFDRNMTPLHFRLEGPPGVGKNEIVYQLARELAESMNIPFYSIQGHEEMTPEDLSILVVPDSALGGLAGFRLQASPLATTLMEGGLFFFDEINRVPERALAPLASVLDRRCSLYSATTGITLTPQEPARSRFRFCCALNPSVGMAGHGVLPDYIDERTLPVIKVGYLDLEDLRLIIGRNLGVDQATLDTFVAWYKEEVKNELSVRQALAVTAFAIRTKLDDERLLDAFHRAALHTLRPEQLTSRGA